MAFLRRRQICTLTHTLDFECDTLDYLGKRLFFLANLVGHFSREGFFRAHSLSWYYNISSSSAGHKIKTDRFSGHIHTQTRTHSHCRVGGVMRRKHEQYQMQFRFFLKPYCFRRMTISLLAHHPEKKNIIRTRERIIRIFPQTHTQRQDTQSHAEKGQRYVYFASSFSLQNTLLAKAQWPLRCRRRSVPFFDQLKKIAKYFFFPSFKPTSQQNFSFFLLVWPPRSFALLLLCEAPTGVFVANFNRASFRIFTQAMGQYDSHP